MGWMPDALQILLPGRYQTQTVKKGIILHVQEGTNDLQWAVDVSYTYQAFYETAIQYMDNRECPWSQGSGNWDYTSLVFPGYSGQTDVDSATFETAARILAFDQKTHGYPLAPTDSPGGSGVGWHGMGGDAWGGHDDCPGSKILAIRDRLIARAKEIIAGESNTSTPEYSPRIPLPVERSWAVTSNFSDHLARGNPGVDFGTPVGTPVRAVLDGTVQFAGYDEWSQPESSGGWMVNIDHAGGFRSQYLHLDTNPTVAAGQKVAALERIGVTGNSGGSTGPHLHFSWILNGTNINPEPYFESENESEDDMPYNSWPQADKDQFFKDIQKAVLEAKPGELAGKYSLGGLISGDVFKATVLTKLNGKKISLHDAFRFILHNTDQIGSVDKWVWGHALTELKNTTAGQALSAVFKRGK